MHNILHLVPNCRAGSLFFCGKLYNQSDNRETCTNTLYTYLLVFIQRKKYTHIATLIFCYVKSQRLRQIMWWDTEKKFQTFRVANFTSESNEYNSIGNVIAHRRTTLYLVQEYINIQFDIPRSKIFVNRTFSLSLCGGKKLFEFIKRSVI